jgi:uncharacterized protein (TIGR02594 family)
MALPKKYEWLNKETGPKMLLEALDLYGVKEQPGVGNNAEILAWSKEVGQQQIYSADSIPWCGLFMAVVAKRAGKDYPELPLWALSWKTFGEKADKPSLGDVVVFKRDAGGHVGLYVAEDATTFHVLGGNQSDAVTITRIMKTRMVAVRRPKWLIAQPPNVRPIWISADGQISTNEA